MAAFERLMLGRPELTDGRVSVTNICTEAAVSRASYYRPLVAAAIKEILATPQTSRPELETLRDEVKPLKKTEKDLRREHAAAIRELKATINAYANQIQILTLANTELHETNQWLRHRLHQTEPNVIPLTRGP
jgi:hypothetical protein